MASPGRNDDNRPNAMDDFSTLDTNGDGVISREEFYAMEVYQIYCLCINILSSSYPCSILPYIIIGMLTSKCI